MDPYLRLRTNWLQKQQYLRLSMTSNAVVGSSRDEQARRHDHRHGDRDALALTAGNS